MSTWRGQALGTFGDAGTISFHETKNATCGEGGALLLRDDRFLEKAEVVRDKGTDRSRFFRGQVDKYTWVDLGSSHALSNLAAAFLLGQLEGVHEITSRRLRIWNRYHEAFEHLSESGVAARPVVPAHVVHNAHMYYLVLKSLDERTRFIAHAAQHQVQAVFHYVPLHTSPAGLRYGRVSGDLTHTRVAGERLVRLPLWAGMTEHEVDRVIEAVTSFFDESAR
jgi:dTDP-4-amino-4,6-dideoxygalactose transaminase